MDEELTEAEREQLRKLAALQKIAWGILCKWSWLMLIIFAVVAALFSVILVIRSANSVHRFDATTRLIYSPRHVAKVENLGDKQLMTVLDRRSLKRRVAQKVPMPLAEAECLGVDLEISQEKKPSNLFTLVAHSSTWVGAVKKVNAYAEALIDEYIAYRTQDLDNWRESMMLRKKRLQEQLAELDSEESIAKGRAGVASPAETLTSLNLLISDQRRNLSVLNVELTNEQVRKKRLEETIGENGAKIVGSAESVRKLVEDIATLDKEIAQLREVYTDKNPKVRGKLDERQNMADTLAQTLREHGVELDEFGDMAKIEKAIAALEEVKLKIEVLGQNIRALEAEIKVNEEKSETLTEIIPAMERLRVRRSDLDKSMRDLEEQLENLSFAQMSIGNDLRQIEKAGGAGDDRPISLKNFIFAAGGALVCVFVFAMWALALELMLGKVLGTKELGAYGDVDVLGALPKPGAMDEKEESDVMGVVALNFCNSELPRAVTLVYRMPGVEPQRKFRDALDWSLSMAGQRWFSLEIVPSSDFTPPEDAETLICTVRKGSRGWFPIENRYSLAPTELQMLQVDIAQLKEQADVIFLFIPEGMRRGGSFFSQVLSVCDSVLLLVEAGVTPRSWLSYVKRRIVSAERPMLGIVTGASAKAARKEMEAQK